MNIGSHRSMVNIRQYIGSRGATSRYVYGRFYGAGPPFTSAMKITNNRYQRSVVALGGERPTKVDGWWSERKCMNRREVR